MAITAMVPQMHHIRNAPIVVCDDALAAGKLNRNLRCETVVGLAGWVKLRAVGPWVAVPVSAPARHHD